MTKRRDAVKALLDAGFVSDGGTKHETFVHPDGRMTRLPRHAEINELLWKQIKKQARIEDKK